MSFQGWFTKASGGTLVTTNTVFRSSVTVYAHWKEIPPAPAVFTVKFDAQGGTVDPASNVTGTDGKLAALPVPGHENSSMEFQGWFTEAAGGEKVTTDTVFDSDTTIYAQWKETVPVCSHKMTMVDKVEPTCTETGTEAYWTCSICRKMFADADGKKEITKPTVIKATGHDWGEWTVTKKAAVGKPGEQQRVCRNNSAHVEKKVIPAESAQDPENPAKPTDPAEPEKPTDPAEPEKPTDPAEPEKPTDPAEPEKPTDPAEPEKPTDPAEPEKPTDPAEPEKPTDPAEPEKPDDPENNRHVRHDMTKTEKVEPTCTETGTEAYWTCSICGKMCADADGKKEITKPAVIKALGHDWGEWKVTKKATAVRPGEKQRVCRNDPSHAEKKEIPAAGRKKKRDIPLTTMTAKGKRKLKISWRRVAGADGYDIYFSECSHGGRSISCRKIRTIRGNNTFTWTKAGLKKHRSYKARVRAFIMRNGRKKYVSTSPLMHAYTSGGNIKYTNAKSIKVNIKKIAMKKGTTFRITASVRKLKRNKELMPESHIARLRYRSSDSRIASVTKKGKIKARAKGKCSIYVYAHNGVYKRIRVTVK